VKQSNFNLYVCEMNCLQVTVFMFCPLQIVECVSLAGTVETTGIEG